MSNALVGLLTLRLPSLGWIFLASSLRLRFSILPRTFAAYLLVTTQELAAYSCFTTQSLWYSLKDLLTQLSASIRSLVVLHPVTFSVRERGFSSLSFGTRF